MYGDECICMSSTTHTNISPLEKIRLGLLPAGALLFFAGIPFLGWSTLGLLVLFVDWAVNHRRRKPAAPDHSPPEYRVAVLGLVASYFLSSAFAFSKYDGFGTALGYMLAHLFGLAYCYRLERWRPGWYTRYLWIVPLAGSAHAAYGLYQFSSGMTRAVGVHSNPNALGSSMLIAMFLGVIALAGARGPWRWLTIPYVALVTGGLLASGSRGSWVGVAAGAAVFAVMYGWANREAIRRHAVKVAAVLILLVGAVGVSVAVWGNDYALRRFDSIFELDRNRDRVVLYSTVWNMFKAHPVVGVGPNNIKHHYDDFVVVDGRYTHHGFAHNMFLQSLSETGVIGTAFLLLLLYCWLIRGAPRGGPPVYYGLYALLAALVVRDQFDGASVDLNILFLMTWLGATLVAARGRIDVEKES